MIINVKVNPKAKKNLIKKEKDDFFRVYVTAPPVAGKANKAMIEMLRDYFGVSKSKISILSGEKSRLKVVRVDI
jgi:hypothetical protein